MRSPQVEQALYNHPNLVWEYREEVQLSSIDRKKSHQNQARISEPLIPAIVNAYADAAKNGAEFPAIVCYEDSNDTFVNMDGNHRVEALLKAKRETTDAYVVLTEDPLERILLTYELNTINGIPTSEKDRLNQTVNLYHQGFTVADISKHLNISVKRVHEGISDYNGQVRARGLSVQNSWSKIEARSTRVQLQQALTLDKVFSLAVQYVANFGLTTADTKKLIASVKELSSEVDQLNLIRGAIALAEKERDSHKRGQPLHLPVNQLKIHLAYWNKTNPVAIIQAMTADERQSVRPQVIQAITQLEKVISAIG